MNRLVPITLLLVAVLHALPVMGVFGEARLSALYGVDVHEPNLALLLRHRAVLFGLLAVLLAMAALRPALHGAGLLAGLASVGAFLLLALLEGPLNAPLAAVVRLDIAALILLLAAGLVHLVQPATP